MSTRSPRRGGLAAKLALSLASFGVVLTLAEVAAYFVWQARVEASQKTRDERPRKPPGRWDHLPELKGIYAVARPNVRGRMSGVLFETNRYGFRGPERPRDKPQASFRIAVIGDSVAMGPGVLYEETYAARIEQELNLTRADYQYEVLDVGLSGLSAAAVVDRFEQFALPFDPDLVIYGYTLNDIENESYRHSYKRDARERLLQTYNSRSYLWRFYGQKWHSLSELIFWPVGSYYHELDDNYFQNPEAWQAVLDQMDRLAQIARDREMCALILLHTQLEALKILHPYHAYYDAVAEAGQARGFYVARSYDYFRGKKASELWITFYDSHPNARGHELLARAALARLETLPPECWQRRDRRAGAPAAQSDVSKVR